MSKSLANRVRIALVPVAALGLVLAAASPAAAQTGAPPTPIDLFNGNQACSADVNSPVYLFGGGQVPGAGVVIEGLSQDTNPSDSEITEQFQVWPVTDPAQVTTLSNQFVFPGDEGTVTVPAADLSDGQTYAWDVQATGTGGTSALSAPCYFTVDNTDPANPPTVSSPNYPAGQLDQGGAPVQFTLGADGVSDVAGFIFSWTGQEDFPADCGAANIGPNGIPQPIDPYTSDPANFAPASTLGGSATVSLIPPAGAGPETLTVASLDRACNRSPVATYTFDVGSTAPTIRQLNQNPQFDQQSEFQIRANPALEAASPVVSYSVTVLGNTQQQMTVKASASGNAELSLTLDGITGDELIVSSTSADGWVSDSTFLSISFDTTPTVSSNVYLENESSGGVGVPGTFTFAPKVKHVVSYTYSFDFGQTTTTVSASGKGVAQVSWTPAQSGFYDLNVYATTSNGLQLEPYDYFFSVN